MNTKGLHATIAILALMVGSTQALASIQVRIPFEFVVGDKVLPPADYIVETASGSEPGVLRIRKTATGERLMFDTSQIPAKEDPKTVELVFDTVGDKTYLTEVWGVTDSGRGVKHLVDGHPLEAAPEASRKHITATPMVDRREK